MQEYIVVESTIWLLSEKFVFLLCEMYSYACKVSLK